MASLIQTNLTSRISIKHKLYFPVQTTYEFKFDIESILFNIKIII